MHWLDHLDVVGICLGVITAAWVGFVALVVGGRPAALIALVGASVAALVVAKRVTRRKAVIVPALVLGAPLIVALVARQPLFGDGPLGYSNASAALFLVATAAGITVALSTRRTVVRALALAGSALWFVGTWAVEGDTSTIFVAVLVLAVLLRTGIRARRSALMVGVALTLVGLTFASVTGAHIEGAGGPLPGHQFVDATLGELRVELWGEAVALVRQEPLLGVGPGRFREVSRIAQQHDAASWVHNEYLQVTAETGLVGGLLVLALVVWVFARLWPATGNPRSMPAIVALGGVAFNANIDYIWHFPVVPLALALLVGAGSSWANSPLAPSSPARRPLRAAAGAPLLVWVLLVPVSEIVVAPARVIPNGVSRAEDTQGIEFVGAGGLVRSVDPPGHLVERLIAGRELSIEMWVATRQVSQDGPARIVSASDGTSNRNFTVGQSHDRLVFRLRTTTTDSNGTTAQVEVGGVFASTDLQHVVIATDLDQTRVFVDGESRWSGPGPGGRLDAWDHGYPLVFGNESTGDRPWFGRLRSVSIYDRALDADEVQESYLVGATHAAASLTWGSAPVAAYGFGDPAVELLDQSRAGLGGSLEVPSQLTLPPEEFRSHFLRVGDNPILRLVVYAVGFGLLSIPLVVFARRRFPRDAALLVLGVVLAIALISSVVRYLIGGIPSFVDVVGAGAGGLVASVMARRVGLPQKATLVSSSPRC